MRKVSVYLFMAMLGLSVLTIISCKKKSTDNGSTAPIDNTDTVTIHLESQVLYYPSAGNSSNVNANTIMIDNDYDNEAYATMLTVDQKNAIGNNAFLSINVYPQHATTEPAGAFYIVKTPSDKTIQNITPADLKTIYYQRRTLLTQYILPYLSIGWGPVTEATPPTSYWIDISPFASMLSDPDSTVWIVSTQGQPGSNTYKLDIDLVTAGTRNKSNWTYDHVQPLYLSMQPNTVDNQGVITFTFNLDSDLSVADFRISSLGSEGGYTSNILSIDNNNFNYSTRALCVPDSLYAKRNPSVTAGSNSLWNYPTRNWCQGSEIEPKSFQIPGGLKKGTHTLKLDMTNGTAFSSADNPSKMYAKKIGITLLGKKD